MSGLKKDMPSYRFNGNRTTPDEIDRYETVVVTNPTSSATWVGTTASLVADASSALVLINTTLDYPRNLLYGLVGTNDFGGTWTVNGVDQFGNTVTETTTSGTVAAGTPAFAVAGTKIFHSVTSGTFDADTDSVGGGLPRLGVAVGGTVGSTAKFGLNTKIGAVADVKSITHSKAFVVTTLDGGTISTSLVNATNHSFNGTAAIGTADTFTVKVRSTYNNAESGDNLAD